MHVIRARNAHEMLPEALYQLQRNFSLEKSRNGDVMKFTEPVTLVYQEPVERVLFWPERDANPFFHLMECLWMMAGRNDVEFPAYFAKQIAQYSDDGHTLNGAYGNRWRHHFKRQDNNGELADIDQIFTIVQALKDNPDCRRQVLAMWDARKDLGLQSKDLPCNTHAYFSINKGALDMMICNRSNDLVWGAIGANAVHFSFLQEWMAGAIRCPVGKYLQMSNNMHLYVDQHAELLKAMEIHAPDGVSSSRPISPYREEGGVWHFPIISVEPEIWMQDLQMYLDEGIVMGLREPFFRKVINPMMMAYKAWKEGEGVDRYDAALEILGQCKAMDWQLAATEWIQRRKDKFLS